MTTRKERIEQVNLENRARAQLHRFWAFNERAPHVIEHVHAILAEDFAFTTALGESRGKGAYSDRVVPVLAATRFGHQLGAFTARAEAEGVTRAEATFVAQSFTAKDGLVSRAMSYAATLTDAPKALPLFASLAITPGAEVDAPLFVDTYPLNRALATLFAWLAPLEATEHGSAGLRELVVPEGLDMRLGASAEPITTWAGVERWYDTNAAALARSGHWLRRTRVTEAAPGRYRLQAEFDWEGIRQDGQGLAGKTRHDWDLVDTGERFARIQRFSVTAIEPFHPVAE